MAIVLTWPTRVVEQRRLAARAAEALRAGGLVVFPTDTVYGIGVDPSNPQAIRRIYRAKGRPDEKAIAWLVESIDRVRAYCVVDGRAERLAEQFWPGALTMVLKRHAPTAGDLDTLAVRAPAHPIALALISATGGPVATTSANRSGEPSPRTAAEADAQVGRWADLLIDAGPTPGGIDSTVVDLSVNPPRLLRPGAVDPAEIASVLGLSLGT